MDPLQSLYPLSVCFFIFVCLLGFGVFVFFVTLSRIHTCNMWGGRAGVLPAVLLTQRVVVDGVLDRVNEAEQQCKNKIQDMTHTHSQKRPLPPSPHPPMA